MILLGLQDHPTPQVRRRSLRVEVLRDRHVHAYRLREAVRLEQLVVVEEQLAHRVEVGKECAEEPRHLGVVELTVAHLAILLEPVLREGRSPRS